MSLKWILYCIRHPYSYIRFRKVNKEEKMRNM